MTKISTSKFRIIRSHNPNIHDMIHMNDIGHYRIYQRANNLVIYDGELMIFRYTEDTIINFNSKTEKKIDFDVKNYDDMELVLLLGKNFLDESIIPEANLLEEILGVLQKWVLIF